MKIISHCAKWWWSTILPITKNPAHDSAHTHTVLHTYSKFFTMSAEFDRNIPEWNLSQECNKQNVHWCHKNVNNKKIKCDFFFVFQMKKKIGLFFTLRSHRFLGTKFVTTRDAKIPGFSICLGPGIFWKFSSRDLFFAQILIFHL